MSLSQQITQDMKSALVAKDAARLSTLRLLLAAIKNEEIAKIKKDSGLSDEEMITVIGREVKKRRDSIEQYAAAGRQDLADKEKAELEILSAYLPAQMSEDEVRAAVESAIVETGAASAKDFGAVMKALMPKVKGKADGGLVSRAVKEKLEK